MSEWCSRQVKPEDRRFIMATWLYSSRAVHYLFPRISASWKQFSILDRLGHVKQHSPPHKNTSHNARNRAIPLCGSVLTFRVYFSNLFDDASCLP